EVWYPFEAAYCDGSKEIGFLLTDGTGQINNRWFFFDLKAVGDFGTGYEPNTNQVPDASRITPKPVRPPKRAGHDISLSMTIETGGPAITSIKSDLHDIKRVDGENFERLGNTVSLELKNQTELPNRDFVLSWHTADERIQEATFIHAPEKAVDDLGGFFTVILAPPARVNPEEVPPRELIFVLDTSGSMSGQPIEKAKSVMAKAIDAMRPRDTFNMITFSGDTHILWDKPRANTEANRAEAQAFLAARSGGGGTEMMKAIDAALRPTMVDDRGRSLILSPLELANLPADGRSVQVQVSKKNVSAINDFPPSSFFISVREGLNFWIRFDGRGEMNWPDPFVVHGNWSTRDGERVLEKAQFVDAPGQAPLRIVMFLTDGQVGNDDCIICAVKEHAKTTRVFSFGVGDSPNRYLLDGMAKVGRGEVEYVNLQSDADASVERFVKRIATPVLADVKIEFEGRADGLKVVETIPPLDAIPDLFDVKPLIIHGRYQVGGTGVPPVLNSDEQKTRTGETPVPPKVVTLKIRGTTGAGPYERAVELNLPAKAEDHDVIATLWARAKVQELINQDLPGV
ncbi:MAG: VWA domain-containing protein, partial [Phycisphaerales bacterium]|nr:VWA domain-containing protein [Phycisphaerales bacterium]